MQINNIVPVAPLELPNNDHFNTIKEKNNEVTVQSNVSNSVNQLLIDADMNCISESLDQFLESLYTDDKSKFLKDQSLIKNYQI